MSLLTLNTGNDGTLTYEQFLAEKVAFDRSFGFDVRDEWLSPIMRPGHELFKPHQADIVKWAVKGGRRAIFARYGLGKSIMQLEVLRLIVEHGPELGGPRDTFGREVRRALIVAPLGVRFDIIRDARNLLDREVRFVRRTEEIDPTWSGTYVTNYESIRDRKLDAEVEEQLRRWLDGETYALIGKPMMLGRGLNLQQCSTAVFVGVTHKYEQTVQAIHRIHRFGQVNACRVHLIYGETESDVRDNLLTKWQEDDSLTDTMSQILREFGLDASAISAALTRAMGVDREEHAGRDWQIVLNDAVAEWRDHVEAESMGLIVTSIPFSGKYEYSANYADFGHVDDNAQFWWQMDYLTPSLYRALMPGRILAVHVKDFPVPGSRTGAGVYTFDTLHAEAIAHYIGHGFDYFGMITVTTDVVRENNQTYRLSFSEMLKDHSKMGVGAPEYVLIFHKPQTDRSRGYADAPVRKSKTGYSVGQWQIDAAGEWRTGGDRLLSGDELAALDVGTRSKLFTTQSERTVYDYDAHVALADRLAARNALPGTFASLVPGSWRDDVWTDVLRIDTLNSEQRRREVEAHICPFPLDIPRRLIGMYSNPGELVGDPFSGLGSTVLEAVRQGRKGFGTELNPVSVADSVVYLTRHDNQANTPTLFDLIDLESEAVA